MTQTFYVTAKDLADFLGVDDFKVGSKPSKDAVEKLINRIEKMVEHKTNHAWRERQVVEEFADFTSPFSKLFLAHRAIKPLSSVEGDKLEVASHRTIGEWVDFIEEYEQSETLDDNKDFHLDEVNGVYTFKNRWPAWGQHRIRSTYRFGSDENDDDYEEIRSIILYRAAYEFIINNRYHDFMNQPGKDVPAMITMAQEWKKESDNMLRSLTPPYRVPDGDTLYWGYHSVLYRR